MEATVVRRDGDTYLMLRLWTGQIVRVHRAKFPWRGRIEAGTKVEVDVQSVLAVERVCAAIFDDVRDMEVPERFKRFEPPDDFPPAPGMRSVEKSKECGCDQRAKRRANARGRTAG